MINPLNPPIHQIQRSCIRAAVYENVSEEARYVVLFTRLRYEDGRWRRGGTGFHIEDLADLALLIVETTAWLNQHAVQVLVHGSEKNASFRVAEPGKVGI